MSEYVGTMHCVCGLSNSLKLFTIYFTKATKNIITWLIYDFYKCLELNLNVYF